MTWRLSRKEFQTGKGDSNRQAMYELVESGSSPGILAYADKEAIGWCALALREEYIALDRSRVLKPVDNQPVWSISCFFIRKDYRRKGLTVQLLHAAIDYVKQQGGTILEGYPIEPKKENVPGVFAWTGFLSAFEQAGFRECTRHSSTRPIMRYTIPSTKKKKKSRMK
jgi:GNAT superfamily N-acetyltransferase